MNAKGESKMKAALFLMSAFVAMALAATPQVTVKSVTCDAASRTVKVVYSLNETAVVTLSVANDGVALAPEKVTRVWGDANRKVTADDTDKTLWWSALADEADVDFAAGKLSVTLTAWAMDATPDYMAVDLLRPKRVSFYASAGNVPYGVGDDRYKTSVLLMKRVYADGVVWRMGSPVGERNRSDREIAHLVKQAQDYYLGVYEVTQRQYFNIHGSNPSSTAQQALPDAPKRPATQLNWGVLRSNSMNGNIWPDDGHDIPDATRPLVKLRTLSGIGDFDLPTEAQWEYACRAGVGAAMYNGQEQLDSDVSTNANALGWYKYDVPEAAPQPVGLKEPNDWGFYVMLGNVWELCIDWYAEGKDYFDTEKLDPCVPIVEPQGAITNVYDYCVRVGGSYNDPVKDLRSATRTKAERAAGNKEMWGFRLWCGADFSDDTF